MRPVALLGRHVQAWPHRLFAGDEGKKIKTKPSDPQPNRRRRRLLNSQDIADFFMPRRKGDPPDLSDKEQQAEWEKLRAKLKEQGLLQDE